MGHDERALKNVLEQDVLETQGGLVGVEEADRLTNYAVVYPMKGSKTEFEVFYVEGGTSKKVASGIYGIQAALELAEEHSEHAVKFTDCIYCGDLVGEEFMAHNSVWSEANLGRGRIHLSCLEEQLDRELSLDDFNLDLPINEAIRFSYEMGLKAGDRLYDVLARLARVHRGLEEGDAGSIISEAMEMWDRDFGNGRWGS